MEKQIEIYVSPNGQAHIETKFEDDTVWLTQKMMADLFQTTIPNINMHLKNVYEDGELMEEATIKNSLIVQLEGQREVKRSQKYHNLDAIISVGYRIKSEVATKFRQWATQRLKDYLIQGYAINEKRLAQKNQQVQTLKDGIRILSRAIEYKVDEVDTAWLAHFAKGLELLDDYDHEALDQKGISQQVATYPDLSSYQNIIDIMRQDFSSSIFGKEKDDSFRSSVAQIGKGFGEVDFYPTIEEKAATLLYLIIKNHSFVDGNKRIAAACFLLFLEANGILKAQENPIISNEALASLTLFAAASKPEEMETVKKLIVSVLNRNQ
ncbi:RhuM family protein [Dyadobacter sp. CY343]|uniref:RhuM family protein n=1 Tax=Dyadobacter sp. CY343 TaxID=2907299 RepID=UPI001F031B0E|nr:RhuM family protein [Dyadobacter sp. CY343]MCE7062382.1 type II toxin-antitoxin system death-on-curing family toxin [Dyadobacter sp. CY343]